MSSFRNRTSLKMRFQKLEKIKFRNFMLSGAANMMMSS
nr:MAG TPA: hypothetical protein [Caudoviricetes sp.]